VFCRQENFGSDQKLWHVQAPFVGLEFVLCLSQNDFLSEERMEFFKIDYKVPGFFRCEVVVWMDCEVWMVTFICKERENFGGSIWSIVVSEFCNRKELRPIVLLIGAVDLDILFQGLISLFCLSPLLVIARSKMKFHF